MNPHIAIQTSTVTFAYLLFVGGWMAIKEREREREREKEREKRTFQRNH